ncbi:MAG: hypothetical protein U0325_23785 [Polyangiales bacterium]
MDEQSKSAPPTLTDDDIVEVERPNRRSALAAIGASVAAVFGATVLAPSEAEACRRRTGRTDSDPSDGVGRGHTGLTDSDSGDEAQCGRGSRYVAPRVRYRRRSGCTDSDSGPGADGVGQGRFCR